MSQRNGRGHKIWPFSPHERLTASVKAALLVCVTTVCVMTGCGPAPDSTSSTTSDSNHKTLQGTAAATAVAVEPTDASGGLLSDHYQPNGWLGKPVAEISAALASGSVSSETLTRGYLARIEAIDGSGPALNSVLATNPDALAQAMASDQRRQQGDALGPLDGIPVLLKDNIETADPLPTTAGSTALATNTTGRDSPLVAGLRAAGAVILGKTNLSQWANFRSSFSISGWSSVRGLVKNPHLLDRTACGSSSGSGAAVAAALAAAAVGTETNGSIICPSQVNGIVGFKPTVGLVSAEYIVPISPTQDTAGPMTRTVYDAALMLDAMVGSGSQFVDSIGTLTPADLRIGVLRFSVGDNPKINALFNGAVNQLEAAGATVVEINEFSVPDEFWGDELTLLKTEFKSSLDAYLAQSPADIPVRSLAQLIEFNEAHAEQELSLFGQDLFESSLETEEDEAFKATRSNLLRAAREDGIDQLLASYNVDILIAPSGPIAPRADTVNGDVWPAWSGAGYLAAIAGYPHLTVPMGHVSGIPLGLSFIGPAGADQQVLTAGAAWESLANAFRQPQFLTTPRHP